MAVGSECDITRFNIASLCHQLMADSVTSVYMCKSVFICKCISGTKMSGIILLTCRNQMIIDQNNLVRIMQFRKSHFFKFFCHKGDENIMDHHAVNVNRHNVSRLYGFSCIMSDNFFNNRLAHFLLLSG